MTRMAGYGSEDWSKSKMANKVRKEVKGGFDEKKVKLPGEGTRQLTRKAGRLDSSGLDAKSIIVIGLVLAGLLAMLYGTVLRGGERAEMRKKRAEWETACTSECTDGERSKSEIKRCVDRCVVTKEADDKEDD